MLKETVKYNLECNGCHRITALWNDKEEMLKHYSKRGWVLEPKNIQWCDDCAKNHLVLYSNKAKCLFCYETIESKYRHDFVSCRCGRLSVDGGKDYIKRSISGENMTLDDVEELSEWLWVRNKDERNEN